jgi:signal transduction histidine kinase
MLTDYSHEMLQISEALSEDASESQKSLKEILEQELIAPYKILFEKQKLSFIIQHINPQFAPTLNHSRLSQIFHNLTLNAMDSLMTKRENDHYLKYFPELRYQVQIINRPKETVLYFTDTGIGITQKALPQIFKNGFSTKGKKGNGIGLSSVKNVVEKLNGYIGVHSIAIEESLKKEIFYGRKTPTTTFRIALPV